MSSPISFLRKLLDAGMPLDMALTAAETFEHEVTAKLDLRKEKDRARKRRTSANSAEIAETAETAETAEIRHPRPLDKEIPPGPPKEINPPSPENARSRSERADYARRMREEVREAAGDALPAEAVGGVPHLGMLKALLAEAPACDWDLDVLPAVSSAAAWHRRQSSKPGSMTNWTVAIRIARENRDKRLNPPPSELINVRRQQPSTTGHDPRTAARLERYSDFDAASRAALRQGSG